MLSRSTGSAGRRASAGGRRGSTTCPTSTQTTWAGISADIAAGAAHARSLRPDAASLFTIGFCFGGRAAFLSATLGLGLAGAIGFYGSPVGPGRAGMPAPADEADRIESPILGLFGGADAGIPPAAIDAFDAALGRAGVEHRLISYPDAPHSFFDRKAAEYQTGMRTGVGGGSRVRPRSRVARDKRISAWRGSRRRRRGKRIRRARAVRRVAPHSRTRTFRAASLRSPRRRRQRGR